ncbi:MAG: hypothetical protein LUE86_08305 [Clostridiales bacterium]|nr:hypothetical protein [Clostridiales bacterium]
MRKPQKMISGLLAAALACSMAMPAYASTSTSDDTKVGSIYLDFDVENPEIGESIPDTLDVTTTTEGIIITDAYYTNNDSEWERGDDPVIKVTIETESGYYFSSPKISRVSGLSDVKSKSVKKDGDKYNAIVTIKLDEVEGDLEEPEDPDWTDTVAEWDDVEDAEYYSVRLYRDGKKVVTISTDDESFDFYPWMTRKGDYTFEVKAKADKSSDDSDWSEESDELEISSSEVYTGTTPSETNFRGSSSSYSYSYSYGPGTTAYSSGPSSSSYYGTTYGTTYNSGSNGWSQDTTGWKYYQNGSQVTYSWVRDGSYWYYIGTDGYMKTGWQQINGSWYYMNENSGDPLGSMRIGWLNLNGVWYYMDSNGVMVTGYQTISNNAYYFTESGALLMNGSAPDGRTAGTDGILR